MTVLNYQPVNAGLAFVAGDDVQVYLTVQDSSGAIVNLTGYTVSAYVYTPDKTKSNFTVTIPAPATGVISMVLPSTETALLTGMNLNWSVQWVNPAGQKSTIINGQVSVLVDG